MIVAAAQLRIVERRHSTYKNIENSRLAMLGEIIWGVEEVLNKLAGLGHR